MANEEIIRKEQTHRVDVSQQRSSVKGLAESVRGFQSSEKQSRYDTFNEAKAFYSSPEWRKLRSQALKLYGGRCVA